MKIFPVILLLALAPGLASAAPGSPTRDLGQGLGFRRVHTLPTDLPTEKTGALVLDLRFAQGDDAAATAFGTWLNLHSSTATPVFILVNAETSPAALAYLGAREPVAGLITLGAASPRFAPDIALPVSAAADRLAYDALEQGTALAILLTDTSAKVRHDEASIAQDRIGSADDFSESDPDLPDPPGGPDAIRTPPAPLIDHVLLRAVQLHRALLALRKL